MAFCTNCGTPFNDKQEFCTGCGALLKQEISNKTHKSEDSSEPENKANTNVSHLPMSIGTKIIILELILLLILIIFIVYKETTAVDSSKEDISRYNESATKGNRNGDNDNTIEKSNNKIYPKDYEQYKEQINELEREAEKWIKNGCSFEEKQGEYFSFSCGAVNPCTDCGSGENKWTATSEVEIGDCPAGSVWIMLHWGHEGGEGGNNKILPECKSITPIIITDFNFEKSYYE